jgi:nucleobase:cation symporter-1, NCS1 family
VNPLAIAAFVPSAVVSLTLALFPTFSLVAPFGWFIGAALSALLYFVIARGRVAIVPEDLTDAGRPTHTTV